MASGEGMICGHSGGVGIGAGHTCICVRTPWHAMDSERPHGCACGALWEDDGKVLPAPIPAQRPPVVNPPIDPMPPVPEEVGELRAAVIAMASALGAALPHTPEVMTALRQLDKRQAAGQPTVYHYVAMCEHCSHPDHPEGLPCGFYQTETVRDDVSFGAFPPSGEERVLLTGVCRCTKQPRP